MTFPVSQRGFLAFMLVMLASGAAASADSPSDSTDPAPGISSEKGNASEAAQASRHAHQFRSITVRLGAVDSISLPADWKPSESEGNSTDKDYYPRVDRFADCRPMLTVQVPYKGSPQDLRQLERILSGPEHQLTPGELSSLGKLITRGTTSEHLQFAGTPVKEVSADVPDWKTRVNGQVVRIDGKTALIVEESGRRQAPCIFMPDGSRRMPFERFWVSRLYVLLPGNKVQEVILYASSRGVLKDDCLRTGRRAIRTVKWRPAR